MFNNVFNVNKYHFLVSLLKINKLQSLYNKVLYNIYGYDCKL